MLLTLEVMDLLPAGHFCAGLLFQEWGNRDPPSRKYGLNDIVDFLRESEPVLLFVGEVGECVLWPIRYPGLVLCLPKKQMRFQLIEELSKFHFNSGLAPRGAVLEVATQPLKDGFIEWAESMLRIGPNHSKPIGLFWLKPVVERRKNQIEPADSLRVFWMFLPELLRESPSLLVLHTEGDATCTKQRMKLEQTSEILGPFPPPFAPALDDQFADIT